MIKHVIYGLIDPNTKELRYVGYTSHPEKRLNQHYSKQKLKAVTHKNSWIKSLKDQKPEMIIIEEYASAKELSESEIEMIEYFRFIGCNLTNTTKGGEGGATFGHKGKRHTKETKLKISIAGIGRVMSKTTKIKKSIAMKGKTFSHKGKTWKVIDGKRIWINKDCMEI